MDHPVLNNSWVKAPIEEYVSFNGIGSIHNILEELRNHARTTNKIWSKRLDIPESAAITCVEEFSTLAA